MNPGGEPERDDTGLPPVDIKIPDDARDLDRDVQAYRRELRARRRSDRRGRWHRSLGRDGVALPLLACCLVLALITGTLLTVFTATSSNLTGGSGTGLGTSGGPAPTMVTNRVLPEATISVDGSAPIPVQELRAGILVLVPPGCDCSAAFNWLGGVASKAGVPAYVLYTSATKAEVRQLYSRLASNLHGLVQLAKQTSKESLLSHPNLPAGLPADQLTAILVAPDHVATWVSHISPRDSPASLVEVLTGVSV